MALAVLRKCVMSRITMGVTRKLKEAATCRTKPVYNAFEDWESPAQYEYLYDDDYVEDYEEEDLPARRSKFKYISPGVYEYVGLPIDDDWVEPPPPAIMVSNLND